MTSDPNLMLPLIASLAAPYALVLAAPGPNLLLVLRASLVPSLARPVAAALGIASGATVAAAFAAYFASFLSAGWGLDYLATFVFSVILLRSAHRLWFNVPTPNAHLGKPTPRWRLSSIFALGLFGALSNPMSLPFFISFFVANVDLQPSLSIACFVVFLMALIWFSVIGVLFAKSVARKLNGLSAHYLRRGLASMMTVCAIASVWSLIYK